MMNNCLQCYLCPGVKNSSQWKHLLSLRRWAISAGVKRRTVVGDEDVVAMGYPDVADDTVPIGCEYHEVVRPEPYGAVCAPMPRDSSRCS
jgi:hypothetical protein